MPEIFELGIIGMGPAGIGIAMSYMVHIKLKIQYVLSVEAMFLV